MCTPPLVHDLIREILLRFPPDDPACLARAALTCKPWRRIVTDLGFLRRYREFHRTPPMLGFLHNTLSSSRIPYSHTCIARFMPTSTFRPATPDRRGMYAVAARHGRVLLQTDLYAGPVSLVVWDPVTDVKCCLPPLMGAVPSHQGSNAVVLCAAAGCDHLDCHGGPFAVAFVGLRKGTLRTFAWLYSSEAGEWGRGTPAKLAEATTVDGRPGVIVGSAVYFTSTLKVTRWIVEYDMAGMGRLSVIDPPLMHQCQSQTGTMLTVTEDGKLGFAGVRGLRLYLWSRQAGPNGAVVWIQRRVVELDTMLLHFRLGNTPVWHVPSLVGFADGPGAVFLMTETGSVFSIELESGRCRKMTSFPRFHNGEPGGEPMLIPYMSFYTPDRKISILEEA